MPKPDMTTAHDLAPTEERSGLGGVGPLAGKPTPLVARALAAQASFAPQCHSPGPAPPKTRRAWVRFEPRLASLG